MTELTRVRIARESPPPAVRPSGQLDVVLMPWNTEAEVSDDGRTTYREKWESGSLVPDGDAVPVYGSHITTPRGLERGPLIGVARNITDGPDGLHATLHLGTDEGRRIHELAAMGVRAAVSIEADAGDTGPDDSGMVVRTAANPALLTGVATILPPQHPAYAGALVTAVRAAPTPPPEDEEEEEEETDPNTDPPAPDEDEEDDKDKEDDDMTELATLPETTETGRAAVAELVRTEVARYGLQRTNKPAVHPLARFGNELELLTAARAGTHADQQVIAREFHESYQAHRELARALVNQITPDNPGVLPPTWLSTIFGTIDAGRPGITAMGGPAIRG